MNENPKEYDLLGVVHVIKPTETHGRFSKRILVLAVQRDKRDAFVSLEATYERIAELDAVSVGDELHVRFTVDGREWNDKRTGEIKFFTTLGLSRFKTLRKAPPVVARPALELDEVPF